MRTTLTLEPDVAAALRRRQRERGTSFKQEVNELLRRGLADEVPDDDRSAPVLPTLSAGGALFEDWDELKTMVLDRERAEDLERSSAAAG